MYLVGSPPQGQDLGLEFWGSGGGVWPSAFSMGDLWEPLFPSIRAGVGRGTRQTPVAFVGAGLEPEAVWCSVIEYRSQSVPCGHARMGREGRQSPLSPPGLVLEARITLPPHLRGLQACPGTQTTWFAKKDGRWATGSRNAHVNTVCVNWVFSLLLVAAR